MSFTPEPPGLSVAVSITVTLPLFQPFWFEAGDAAALVVGAVPSAKTDWLGASAMFVPPTRRASVPALLRMVDVVGSTERLSASFSVAIATVPSAAVNAQSIGPVNTLIVGVEQWNSTPFPPTRRIVPTELVLQWRPNTSDPIPVSVVTR